ncbi:PAS domain S-box protein [Pontibacter diazotrophicus]|uniref:histidine kinase n=1 Tax=Pontibacter diazotrophicus TaxID=1400979 RepID=A0A3D8LGV0_9BACT|nr:PAS domain-containing protein [Pontibacter diazotrophicus]RDV16556.1 PAS domain S-box protein [Pontibacter diazotrophicus]
MHQAISAEGYVPAPDFNKIFNTLPGNLLLLQPNPPIFTILAVSDEQLQITGQERQDVVGKSVFTVYPDNPEAATSTGPSNLKVSLQNALNDKVLDQMPVVRYDLVNAAGVFEERYWKANNRPVLDAEGNVLYILLTSSEITGQVMAERRETAIREIEKKYSLFMQAPLAFSIVKGPDHTVELANEELLKTLGRTTDIIGKPLFGSIPKAKDQGLPELLDRVRKTGKSHNAREFPLTLEIGGKQEVRYYTFVFQPYYEEPGGQEAVGVFSVWHDVTDQVLARRKVEESEQQIRSFIESSHHPIGVYIGREMRIQFANQTLKDSLGKGNDIVGKLYRDVLPELENQEVFEQLDEVYTTGIPFQAKNHRLELVVDGELREHFFDLSLTPLFNAAGEVYGIINTGADVTELNHARERVAESESRFRTLVQEASVGIIVLAGEQMRVEVLNKAYSRLIGRAEEELLGNPLFSVIPETEESFRPIIDKVRLTGEPLYLYEQPYFTYANGNKKEGFLNLVYQPYKEPDGTVIGVMVLCHDVTEQVLASKKAEQSARDLQNLANAMPQLVWIAAPDGTRTYYNNRISEFTGASQLPDGTWHWESMLSEEDEQRTVEAWGKAVRAGTLYEIEHRLRMRDGSNRWHLSRALPQRDSEGKVTGWFGTATDVHERKEQQEALEAYNTHLKSINNDLDNFIYTASHDLKAPIFNIEGLLALLSEEHTAVGERSRDTKMILQMMEGSVDRFKKTIESLTDIAKLQQENEQDAVLVNLQEVIEEVAMDLAPMIKRTNATLKVDIENGLYVHFSHKNLRSVVYNLLANAIKYHSPDRAPKVWISCESTSAYKVLTIADNGLGISPRHSKEIFTMFKRFHDHVEGTGIGLYMVKKMVENAGGIIKVESKENKGTTFRINLPA